MIFTMFAWCLAGPIEFDVETIDTELSRATQIELEYALWQAQDFYASRFGVKYPETIHLDVVVYGDLQAYRTVAEAAGRPSWSGGWFAPSAEGKHRATFHSGETEEELAEVFRHEGSHFLIAYGGRIPRWLNEGVAEALGYSHGVGSELIVTTPSTHRSLLTRHGAGSVEALVMDPKKWKDLPQDSASDRYVRAWALCTMLLSTSKGGDTLEAIARAYRRTGEQSSGIEAIDAHYPGGLAGLQKDFEAFCKDLPSSVTISKTLKGPLNSDAMWTNCPDGRLVQTDVGCGG